MTALTVDPHSERALVAAAQAGDERAFRALVEPYRRALEIHCYRMLGSSVTTWLYRIATNACLDELERRPRRPEPVVEPYPDARLDEAVGANADPAARYAAREGMELAFLTAIQRLPGRQRAVLLLRDVLGWTGAEVAELLDTTVAAANSALQRARATIEQEEPARVVAPGRATQAELLRRYVEAWQSADVNGLVALLREDAVLTMPPTPAIVGAAAIGAFFERVCPEARLKPSSTWANGLPAMLLRERGADGVARPHRLLVLEPDADGRRVAGLRAYRDPALLAAFAD